MGNMNKPMTAIILSFLMLASAPVLIVPPEAEAQGPTPVFILEVHPNVVFVDLSPGGSGVGQTNVTVTNEARGSFRVEVHIEVPGYQVTPEISTVIVDSGESTTINVAVAAMYHFPDQVDATVHGEVIRVDEVVIGPGFYYMNTGFLVTSQPFGEVDIWSNEGYKKMRPGKEYTFELNVKNHGNAPDTFSIDITNIDELRDEGFSINLSSTEIKNLDPQSSDTITLHVETPRDLWKDDHYSIDIRATSNITPEESSEYSIIVWVKGAYTPGLGIAFTIMFIAVVGAILVNRRRK